MSVLVPDSHARRKTLCMHEGMSVLQDERSRVKEQQDGAYHRMQALKQQSKGKKDAYYQNRRFSQEVLTAGMPV